jgi:hypothetical protein
MVVETAEEEHDFLGCDSNCWGFYLELCGDDLCNGCIPICCPCRCHKGQVCVCGKPY